MEIKFRYGINTNKYYYDMYMDLIKKYYKIGLITEWKQYMITLDKWNIDFNTNEKHYDDMKELREELDRINILRKI